MYKALIIGCGNIGALYDFDTAAIATYAKAFHIDPEIEFDVYDADPGSSLKVAERYGVRRLTGLNAANCQDYDVVVVSTSTPAHYQYLSRLLERGPQLVICEKPVDIDRARLDQLLRLHAKSETKVLVNFFRRFQPGMIRLKQKIVSVLGEDQCTNIIVTYQRGFHNNASHAIDLLEYLWGSTIDLAGARLNHHVSDEFDADPTLSMSCIWNGINVQFIGLTGVQFSHLEISIYFTRKAVLLKDGGNEIEILLTPSPCGNYYPKLSLQSREVGVLDDYMVNVVDHAKRILRKEEPCDNFPESVSISKRILELQGH